MAKRAFMLLMLTLGACVPDVEEADTLVVAERVLAIQSNPAEAAPRAGVELRALYVSPEGTLEEGALRWAFCTARKSLAELGPVSPLCLAEEGDDLVSLGEGLAAEGDVPDEACRLFGPDRPPPKMGEPAGRPVDPDPTGGYYQPVRVLDAEHGEFALYQARVRCGLPGAAQAQVVEYNQRYTDNENPEIEALRVRGGGVELPDEGDAALRLDPSETLELRLEWADPETYAYFDPRARALSERREAMRVSWFSTGGSFREPRTGQSEQEADVAHSDNAFTAPAEEGDITLWAVLRDDRGGVTWRAFALRVQR